MNSITHKETLFQRLHLRTLDLLHLGYLGVTGVLILIFRQNQHCWFGYFLIRIVLGSGIVVLNLCVGKSSRPKFFWRLLRDWYTPLFFIYYYEETECLNQLIVPLYFNAVTTQWHALFAERMDWLWNGLMYLDPVLEYWDQRILGFQPSIDFYRKHPDGWLSELMHFGYFSYYTMIPMLGFTLWYKKRMREFHFFMVAISLNMLWCYLFFIVFPTSGPKSYFPGAHDRADFSGYVFKWLMDIILEHGEISNGAFPSSHVAMATVILLCAAKFERTVFWIMLPLVLLLYVSTMYLREHYFVDIPSGILVGAFFFIIAGPVKRTVDRWVGYSP